MAVGGAEQFQYILDIVAKFNEASVLEGLRAIQAETEKLRATAAKVSAGGGGNYTEAIRQVALLEQTMQRVATLAASVKLPPQLAAQVAKVTAPGTAAARVTEPISRPATKASVQERVSQTIASVDPKLAQAVTQRIASEEAVVASEVAVVAANKAEAQAIKTRGRTFHGTTVERLQRKGGILEAGLRPDEFGQIYASRDPRVAQRYAELRARQTGETPAVVSFPSKDYKIGRAGSGIASSGMERAIDAPGGIPADKIRVEELAAIDAYTASLAKDTAAHNESAAAVSSAAKGAGGGRRPPPTLPPVASSGDDPEEIRRRAREAYNARRDQLPTRPPVDTGETPEERQVRRALGERATAEYNRAKQTVASSAAQKAADDALIASETKLAEQNRINELRARQAVRLAAGGGPDGKQLPKPRFTGDSEAGYVDSVRAASKEREIQEALVRRADAFPDGISDYTKDVAAVRLALQQQSAATERALAGTIFMDGEQNAYAKALSTTRIAQAKTNASVNALLAASDDYAKSLAQNRSAQARVKAKTEQMLLADNAYIEATAEAANARRSIAARAKIAELQGQGFEKVTPRGFVYADKQTPDAAEITRRQQYGLQQLTQLEGISQAMAQYRRVQTELIAATERQVISSRIAAEQAAGIAGDKRTEAQLVAQRRAIEARLAADLETELALNNQYKEASAELALLKRQRAAAEKAALEQSLAGDRAYIEATAEAAVAKRLQAARIKEQELAGIGLDKISRTGLVVPGGEGTNLAALQALEAQNAKQVSLEKARITIAESAIVYDEAELGLLNQAAVAQRQHNEIMRRRIAAAQRAAYEEAKRGGAGPDIVGTKFQQFQAGIANRGDASNFKDPTQYAQLGQFLKSKFLTTAGFAVSGIVTYAAFSGIQRMVSDSADLERVLSQVRAQFEALGEGNAVDGFVEGIKQISRESGEAASNVAKIAFQFKGAFGDDKTNAAVLKEAESAVKISRVTGLSLEEVTDSLTSTALNYGETIDHIGGATLALQDRTGVLAKHIITAIADLAPVAEEVGLEMEKIGAIAAVAQKKSGQTGAVLAESLNRILPTIGENSGELIQFFRQNRPGEADEVLNALATGKTGAVFDIIGRSYDDLTDSQQKYVQSLLGTKKDLKGLIPVLNSYGEVIELTTVAEQEKGRLDKSYAALQQTLSQQLQRVAAAFKNIGQALLSLGVSETIQNLAKVIGVVVVAASDFVQIFATINNVMGGLPSKVLAIVATLLVLTKALKAYRDLAIGTAIVQGITSVPGRILGTGPKRGPVGGPVETTTPTGLIIPPTRTPEPPTPKTPVFGATRGKLPNVEKGIIGLGERVSKSAIQSSGMIAAAKTRLGGALTSMGGAIASLVPIIAIMGVIQAITNAISGFTNTRQKLEDLRSQFLSEAGSGTEQEQKSLDKYAREREKARKGRVSINPLTNFKTIGGQFAAIGSKDASDLAADAVQKQTTQAFSRVLTTQLSDKQLEDALKQSNASALAKYGLDAKQLDKKDIDRIAKEGTVDNKEFQAVIDLFTTSAEFKEGLGKAYQATLDDQKDAAKKVADLNANLDSLPTLLIKADVGLITPQEFQSRAAATRAGLIDALNIAIKQRSDPELINSLKSELDQTSQALDQSISKYITDQVAAKGLITTISGASNLETLQASLRANTSALSVKGAATSSAGPQLAQTAVQAQRDILQYMLDHAKSNAEAQKILDEGLEIPEEVANALEITQLKSGLPPDVHKELVHSAAALGKGFDEVLYDIVTAKGGIRAGIQALIDEILAEIAALERAGKGNYRQTQNLRSHAANLQRRKNSSFFNDIDRIYAPGTEPSTPEQEADALASYRRATVGDDPLAAALLARQEADRKLALANRPGHATNTKAGRIAAVEAIATADQQYKDVMDDIAQSKVDLLAAAADGDPVKIAQANIAKAQLAIEQAKGKGTAAENAAKAQLIAANQELEDAFASISDARFSVLLAMSDGDPLAAAQIAMAQANEQASRAKGEAEKLQALAAQISAQHAIRDAVIATADAQSALLIAIATAAGDTVKAAQLSLQAAKDALNRDLARGLADTDPRLIADRQRVVEQEAALRDTALNDATSDIQYLLHVHKISNSQAIARLRILLQNQKLTDSQQQQIKMQIYDLQHASQQDLQFNLPSNIKLPTLYEGRRFGEGGGGSGGSNYQDNRKIEVHISTNAKLDGKDIERLTSTVTEAVQAPPRYGNRSRAY